MTNSVGGLVGYMQDCTLTASYATGTVNGRWSTWVAWWADMGSSGTLTASYATGTVAGMDLMIMAWWAISMKAPSPPAATGTVNVG